jgi:amino acid transporter
VAARVGLVVLIVELAVLVVFVVAAAVVLAVDGPTRPWASVLVGVSALDGATVMSAVSIAVLSFLGFDAIASFAEEATGDTRQVGRAIGVCLAVAGAAFVAQTALASLVSPIAPGTLAATPARQGTAFYDIVRAAIGGWLAVTLAITKAVGPAFAAMTAQAAAARLLFGMARDGRLPRALGRVEPRRGVPATALVTTGALTLVVAVWAARRADGLPLLVSIVDVGALSAFALLHGSVLGYFVAGGSSERRRAHWLVPLAGIAVTLWVLFEASALAQSVGLAWAVAGGVVLWLRAARRGDALAPTP